MCFHTCNFRAFSRFANVKYHEIGSNIICLEVKITCLPSRWSYRVNLDRAIVAFSITKCDITNPKFYLKEKLFFGCTFYQKPLTRRLNFKNLMCIPIRVPTSSDSFNDAIRIARVTRQFNLNQQAELKWAELRKISFNINSD